MSDLRDFTGAESAGVGSINDLFADALAREREKMAVGFATEMVKVRMRVRDIMLQATRKERSSDAYDLLKNDLDLIAARCDFILAMTECYEPRDEVV